MEKQKHITKFFSLLLAVAFVLIATTCVLPMPALAAGEEGATIVGNSVYRPSATSATVRFLSDKAGTAYYQITESAAAPSTASLVAWTNADAVTANVTKTLSLTPTSGTKYVHIVVQSGSALSNVLTVSMPQDYYYREDFGAYPENTYVAQSGNPLAPISQMYGGTGNANQKVSAASGDKYLSLSSTSGTASMQRITLPANYREGASVLVLKGKVKPLSEGPSYHESALFGIGDRKNGVLFINGRICYADKSDINNINYNFNQWYEIELDVDLVTNTYDIKVDGTTVASNVTYNDSDKYVLMFAGHSTTAYFDDVELYTMSVPKVEYFKNFSTTLGTDIKANCYVDLGEVNPANAQVRFTMNGKTVTVDGTSVGEEYKYVFEGVAPQCMGDTLTAELFVEGCVVDTKEYTVLGYLNKLKDLSKEELGYTATKYNAMVALINDLLIYGGAAQTYTSHNIGALVSDGVTGSTYTALTALDDQLSLTDNGTNATFTSATLNFDNVNRLKIKFTAENTEGLTIKYSVNDVEKGALAFTLDGSGNYILETPDILAVGFDDVYTFTAYKNDTEGATLTYSVRSYVYVMQNNADINMANLAKATYNYGLSAKAFKSAS